MELSQLTAVPRAGTRSSCPFGSRAVLPHKPLPRTILSANLKTQVQTPNLGHRQWHYGCDGRCWVEVDSNPHPFRR